MTVAMLSFRSVTRSLPQTASRLATRTALRPAFQSSIARSTPVLSQRVSNLGACFSTTSSRFDSSAQELAAKLESEIEVEKQNTDNETESDTNVSLFKAENDFWQIEDVEDQQEIVMRRKYEDETITLSFSIADFDQPSMMSDEEADEAYMDEEDDGLETAQSGGANSKGAINQGRTSAGNFKVAPEDSVAPGDREELRDEEDDYEGQQAFPANVNVLIQRGNGKGALRVNLITDSGQFTINSVTHLPENTIQDPVETLRNSPDALYAGPPFQQLDEEVQSLLERYLTERGINERLAVFIPDYIDVKEQKEYLRWLARVKDFVN